MRLLEEMGARLRAERNRLDLTQDQMAALVGVSKRALASYEVGTREAGAALLSLAAGVDVDVLFVLTGAMSPQAAKSLSADEAGFVAVLRDIADSDRSVLMRTAHAFAKANSLK